MIGLIQRVSSASVVIAQQETARIEGGVLALIGVEKADSAMSAGKLLNKILDYRIFADEQGRMNLSLRKTGGGLLLVPQFTLVADTSRGLRPGFSTGARPADAQALFDALVVNARGTHPVVAAGTFGADMQVSLVNDGPVTFWLQIDPE